MLRVSDREFVQIYINSFNDNISEEEIASRIGISLDEYHTRISVIQNRIKKIGSLPKIKKLREVPF